MMPPASVQSMNGPKMGNRGKQCTIQGFAFMIYDKSLWFSDKKDSNSTAGNLVHKIARADQIGTAAVDLCRET